MTTIVTHTKELITVFSRDLELITRVLFSTNFIQDDILLQMSSEDTPTGKAAIVVEAVKKKLEIAPERFAEFLKIISENAKDIVDGLSSTYQSEFNGFSFQGELTCYRTFIFRGVLNDVNDSL